MQQDNSFLFFEEAKKHIPGGVNSPVRAFTGVNSKPIFIESGEGPYIFDVDGKRYIDYIGSWGPLILGHKNPQVYKAITAQLEKGVGFGTVTTGETDIAIEIKKLMPAIEQIRFVNSGTEATMSAIRLARAYTDRDKIIKFEGNYHGHSDSLLVKAGSGGLTFGVPSSPGVPESITQNTLVAKYNDLNSVNQLFSENENQIAAIILEPIAGNMNLIMPTQTFIEGLREICSFNKAVLIFDEVMTGFRVALGGATSIFNVTPDLITLGKIIGGGLPVGAFGGKKEIMSLLSPEGFVYQAGTLSGNPLAVSAGLATIRLIQEQGFYEKLSANTKKLCLGIESIASTYNIPIKTKFIGGMFGIFFTENDNQLMNLNDVMACNNQIFKKFHVAAIGNGVYMAPSAFEAGFVSATHDGNVIAETLDKLERVFSDIS